jgi:hypothetical protein
MTCDPGYTDWKTNPEHEICLFSKEIDWASPEKEFALTIKRRDLLEKNGEDLF